jgi:hypothetical protein
MVNLLQKPKPKLIVVENEEFCQKNVIAEVGA